MKSLSQKFLTAFVALTFVSCSTSTKEQRKLASADAVNTVNVASFPEVKTDPDGRLFDAVQKAVRKASRTSTPEEVNAITNKIKHYLLFLGLTARDFNRVNTAAPIEETDVAAPVTTGPRASGEDAEEDDGDSTPSNLKAIKRLFGSSTQFMDCQDLRDWDCLEQAPKMVPSALFRQPRAQDLGTPIRAGASLDMDVFFTEGWDNSPRAGVVDRFAERLRTDAVKSLSIAMYGIDDTEGSMKPVYDEIKNKIANPSVNVRSVVDVAGLERSTTPWIFDYVDPGQSSPELAGRWLFGRSTASGRAMHANFQYDGTPDFIREMNGNIRSTIQAKARIEWPTSHIMHNKYAVMEKADGSKSVWTGTANISNHCMGTEANSNMAVYIKNDAVAQAYLDEFNLMYEFDPALNLRSRLAIGSPEAGEVRPFKVGRFHHNKYPVSHRNFTFDDGTRVRVHFAPTDDAEHRAILPMLYSAQAGDEIRVSMFGGTGYEIVRAFQFAAARGANIRIVFDRALGHGLTSWIRDAVLNLNSPNPYLNVVNRNGAAPGTIQVKVSTWSGKNHYKVGSLTRKQANGSMIAEQIILGSQNWSSGGNDYNDENLISIQNLTKDVASATQFNREFDTRLWVKSMPDRRF